ncbi:MAG: protein kinase [Aphanizomenon gracile PMC638.10]|nr:protein kinase [Aphanizomenon gracile PMC638.10]
MIGKTIHGRYKIVYFLGGGGFGRAYLAKDINSSDNNWCVVKQLKSVFNPLNNMNYETAKRLFYTEAETLRILGDYDQIPKLFDFFEENQHLYLVEEFIDGYELTEEINNRSFNEQEIYYLLFDILTILKFVQDNNVIHRDISPDNLIRRKQDNKLVLIDFGAVKQLLIDPDGKLRRKNTIIIGKEDYMPHEQADGRPGYYSDIYAVGIIGIQACIGHIPVKDYDSGEITWKHDSHISSELANILDKMTTYYVKNRYQSALEVLTDLEKLSYLYINSENQTLIFFKYNYTQQWYARGNNLKKIKHHNEAILLYKKVLEINSSHFGSLFNIGVAYSYLSLYEEALEAFNKLLEVKPFNIKTLLHKGIILYKMMLYDEAFKIFELVTQFQPKQALAWFYKTLILQHLNEKEAAIDAYQEAVKLRPYYQNVLSSYL